MRITHIGTADNSGGAARASFHLHNGLLEKGHRSSMVVGQQIEQRPEISRIGFPLTLPGKVCDHLVQRFEMWTGLQYLWQPLKHKFLDHPSVRNADIIHLHNLHGSFFSFTILPMLSKLAPLVWTLHDTWALTGHCSYNYDCERWKSGCGQCPNLGEYPEIALDTTALLWRKKHESYHHSRITVVAPSRWLCSMAQASPLFEGCDVRRVPYGIDLSEFCAGDKLQARDELSIPRNAPVIMVVAFGDNVVGASRKGADFFREALNTLDLKSRPWLLVVGGRGLFKAFEDSFLIREVGYLNSSHLMHRCYLAADVFVSATLADNLPVSLIEAMATGTPSVAFQVGGVPDVIRHQETGYLAKYKDSRDLAQGIRWVLSDESRRVSMGRRCRELAEAEYSLDLEVTRYLELYHSAIGRVAKSQVFPEVATGL